VVKTIRILVTSAALAFGLASGATAQQPAPTPKRETTPPPAEQPKEQPGALRQKPFPAKCETPRLDLYPKEELRPVTGKAPDLHIPPDVPSERWSQPCKLGAQSSADLPEHS
jgi:hypothetical protein